MKELRRILDESSDPVVRALLEASADDAPPGGRGRERAILAAVAALGAPSAAAAATPGAMKAASLVLKGTTAKWLAIAVIAGGSAGTGYAIYTSSPPPPPAPAAATSSEATNAPAARGPAPLRAVPIPPPPEPEPEPVASVALPPVAPPAPPHGVPPTAPPVAPAAAPVASAALDLRREADLPPIALPLPPPATPVASAAAPTSSEAIRATTTVPSLASELALLERARRALVAGRLADAEADLARHDTEFARGPLAPEAEVLRIELALARGDRGRARVLADRLALEQPSSPYARRARKLVEDAFR